MTNDPWTAVPWRWALAGVLVVTALVYLPVVGFPFVYDDAWTIEANGFLRVPGDLPLLFSPEAAARGVPDAFRPTLVAFDVLAYQAFGAIAGLHHATSILLHLGVVALLASWLRRLGAPAGVSLASAAIFGVLAIHAEAVAVVSFREDLLAALFGLGAIAMIDAAMQRTGVRALALGLGGAIAMALACGAKESAVPLAAVWLLAHVMRPFGGPRPSARALAFGTAMLGVGLAVFFVHRMAIVGALDPYGPGDPGVLMHRVGRGPVLAATLPIHLGYLQQMLVPVGLSPEYTDRPGSFASVETWLAAGALAGLFGLALWRARTRPVLAFAVLGAALLAVPTSNLFPMPNLRADRFMYLPSVPVCVGLAAAAIAIGHALVRRVPSPVLALAPTIALVVMQGSVAQAGANVYRSDRRLWEIALRRAPDSARAHAVMGELVVIDFVETGSTDDALRQRARSHCRIAMRLDARDPLPWLCDGRLAAAERDRSRAYRSFAQAHALATVRRDRTAAALAAAILDRPDVAFETRAAEAQRLLDRAMREAPYSSALCAAAASVHHRLGHPERAGDLYARASSLRPERWDLVLAGVELELDLGHPAAAGRRLDASAHLLEQADPARRAALRRRLARASRLWPSD
jgi:hypothetical protein